MPSSHIKTQSSTESNMVIYLDQYKMLVLKRKLLLHNKFQYVQLEEKILSCNIMPSVALYV